MLTFVVAGFAVVDQVEVVSHNNPNVAGAADGVVDGTEIDDVDCDVVAVDGDVVAADVDPVRPSNADTLDGVA